MPKNWCFWTVVLERTPQSPLDSKEIKLVNPKGNQPWTFIGRTDAEAEALILWPPDAKWWLTGEDSDAGKDWGQEEVEVTEDETVKWHHQLNGCEFEQTVGDSEGQRSLVCCSPWGHRIGHNSATEQHQQIPSWSHPKNYCFVLPLSLYLPHCIPIFCLCLYPTSSLKIGDTKPHDQPYTP